MSRSIEDDGRTFLSNATDIYVCSDEPPSPGLLRDAMLIAISVALTYVMTCLHQYRQHMEEKRQKEEQEENDKNEEPKINKSLLAPMSSSVSKSCSMLSQSPGFTASGAFLSGVLDQLWDHMNIAISNTIKQTVEPTLKELAVPLHFIRLDLGNKPIQVKNMLIHSVKNKDPDDDDGTNPFASGCHVTREGVQIDLDLIWDGNCDIMLQATLSKSAKLTFGVEHIKVRGRMLILLSPLTTELPVISAIQYGFTNPPDVSLKFKGAVLGTLTNKLDFVQSALLNAIQSTLASMLVLPMRMCMPMDLGSYDYLEVYQPPVGMVRVTPIRGRGFTVLKKIFVNDIPDIYCKISVGSSDESRTTTQKNNCNPSWKGESFDFILYDFDQKIKLRIFDEDTSPLDPDDELGTAEISVRELFMKDGTAELELIMDGKKTGCYVTISAEMFHLSDQIQSLSSAKYEGKNHLCGLYTIVVTKAFDIPLERVEAATYINVQYGCGGKIEKTFYTGTVADYPGYDALNPMYDQVFYVPITSKMLTGCNDDEQSSPVKNVSRIQRRSSFSKSLSHIKTMRSTFSLLPENGPFIKFTLIDGEGVDGSKGHGELGSIIVPHDSLINAKKHSITEVRPIGDAGAKLEFRVVLNGMLSEEEKLQWEEERKRRKSVFALDRVYSRGSSGSDVDHTKKIRVTALRGRGFTITKRGLGKKNDVPDVYLKVSVRTSIFEDENESKYSSWRTRTIKDDTMPKWAESKDFITHPTTGSINVDAYDENRKGKDDYIGSAEISMERILRKRMMELELRNGKAGTGCFVTLKVVLLDTESHDEVDDFQGEKDDVVPPLVTQSAPPSFDISNVSDEMETQPSPDDEMTIDSSNNPVKRSSRLKRFKNSLLHPRKSSKAKSK